MLKRIWDFFASIRLTVFLLLTLAVTSIAGTLVAQNQSPEYYVAKFGLPFFRIFFTLNLIDMYHSGWFQTLLMLLVANIVVCSIDRFPATMKIVFKKGNSFDPGRFRHASHRESFETERPPLAEEYLRKVIRAFGKTDLRTTPDGFQLMGEKGRFSRFGVYMVHGSVVLLLLGALIGMRFGFDGFAAIPEGGSVAAIHLANGAVQDLGFTLRCDDFEVTFYDSGMPKEYRSRLSILEEGRVTAQKDIIVNDPLRYKGINIFQASYGPIPGGSGYYTGLQVTRDPGVWVVYSGFLLLILGCFVTFFTSHQRIFVEAVRKESGALISVSGASNRNRFGMAQEVKRLARALEEIG